MSPVAPQARDPAGQLEPLRSLSAGTVGAGARLRASAPLLALLVAAVYPLFAHLGQQGLWEDEGDTAVFARAIVRTGLPLAWDGRTYSDCDFGQRVVPFRDNFLMVGTPWLSFYATAASFAAFGESRFAARLPSAAAGLATLALLYALVLRVTGDRRAALAAAVVLLCSAQFLLYAREGRHQALNMLLTLAVLAAFLRLRERPGSPGFAVASVLLFHTQILPAVVVLGACGGLALVHPGFRALRRPFLRSAPWIVAGTAPWLLLTWRETGANWRPPAELLELPVRVGQVAIETGAAIPWLGWAIGLPLLWRRFGTQDRAWLALVGAVAAAVLALAPLALSPVLLSTLGLRYVCGLLPLAAGGTGVLLARASAGSRARLAGGVALFALTHLPGGALPALWLGESGPIGRTGLHANVQREAAYKLLDLETWAFLRGLGRSDPGTASTVAAWLRANAHPDDVLITNYSWDNLYFETGLAQGLHLPPGAPGRAAAQAAGLPAYVFGVEDADWLVWRHGLRPTPGTSLQQIREDLAAGGARLEERASFAETQWENRPELPWHRFPGVGYPFAPARLGAAGLRYPDAVAYRVVWPQRERPRESAREGAS
jgi:4-amino-4-deoxy-L-arabinose transferase-like glycosyltransferase